MLLHYIVLLLGKNFLILCRSYKTELIKLFVLLLTLPHMYAHIHTYRPPLAPVSTDTDGVKERYTGRQTDTEWQRLMLQPYNGSLPSLLYMYLLHISIHLPSTHTSFLYSASIYHSPPPSIPLYGLLVQPQSSRQQYSSIQSSYSSFNIIPCIMTFY